VELTPVSMRSSKMPGCSAQNEMKRWSRGGHGEDSVLPCRVCQPNAPSQNLLTHQHLELSRLKLVEVNKAEIKIWNVKRRVLSPVLSTSFGAPTGHFRAHQAAAVVNVSCDGIQRARKPRCEPLHTYSGDACRLEHTKFQFSSGNLYLGGGIFQRSVGDTEAEWRQHMVPPLPRKRKLRNCFKWAVLISVLLLLLLLLLQRPQSSTSHTHQTYTDTQTHTQTLRMCHNISATHERGCGESVGTTTAVVMRQSVQPMTSLSHDMLFLTTLAQVRTHCVLHRPKWASFVALGPTRIGDPMFPIAAATKIKPLHTVDVDRSTSSHRNRKRHDPDQSLGHNRVRRRAASVP